ncbi:MAG: hypothetical protein GXP62_08555 [Oligoflexia bacterium]|nr:hypothetical protein [Oligoflexia bacterium]
MKLAEPAAWAALLGLSVALCLEALAPPQASDVAVPQEALPRPPTPAERQQLSRQLATLQRELSDATAALGEPPRASQLEGRRPDGQPILASGLPDSPLRAGVAGVLARCPPLARPSDPVDWVYCPETGTITAVGLDDYQVKGSE